jgi:uncharacterized membrane protein
VFAWLVVLLACTGGETADSGACADAPVVTWETFGHGFVTENCQSCHASTTLDRHGAPESMVFDTVDDVWANADRVLVRAGAEPPTMPPEGGTTADDRELLQTWLTCAEKGT